MGLGTAVSTLWKNAGVARTTMKKAGRSMTKAMLKRGAIGAGIGGVANTLRGGEFSDGAVAGAMVGAGSVAYKMAGLGANVYKPGTTRFAKGAAQGFRNAWSGVAAQAGGTITKGGSIPRTVKQLPSPKTNIPQISATASATKRVPKRYRLNSRVGSQSGPVINAHGTINVGNSTGAMEMVFNPVTGAYGVPGSSAIPLSGSARV